MAASLCIFFENESRRMEIALFMMPKMIETIWNYLKRRNMVSQIKYGEYIIFATAMGIINHYY